MMGNLTREQLYNKIKNLVTYCGDYLSCIGVKRGDTFISAMKKINASTCTLNDKIEAIPNLIMVENGECPNGGFILIDTVANAIIYETCYPEEYSNTLVFSLSESCENGCGFIITDTSIGIEGEVIFDYCCPVPTKLSDLENDTNFISCTDLPLCQEIIDLQNSIPTDVSDLTDLTFLFFDRDYNSLNNLPVIGEGDLNISRNGSPIGTFNANTTSNLSVDILVPTKTSDLSNDSGFVNTDTTYSAGLGLKETGTVFSQELNIIGSGDVLDVSQTPDGIQVNKGQINYNNLLNLPDLSVLSNISTHSEESAFPATGEINTVYIAEDTGYMFRWNGTGYTQLTDQTAIWGNISGNIGSQTDLINALALRELTSNKKTTLFSPNNTSFPTTKAVTDYVGNGELDIQVNGVSLQKFNANQAINAIANIMAQPPLVSGVNIKTVGGNSILGSGNIPFPTGLSLGETSTTAYRGDKGKIAYDLSQEIDTTMDFTLGLIDYFIVDYDGLKINSVQNILNTPTVTMTIAGVPYVLGTPLSLGTRLDVNVNTASVIKLKGTR